MVSYDVMNLALNFGIYTLTLVGVIVAIVTLILTKKK
ncbi:putative holin-like toxin [Aneurinibacillus migulanus]